MPIVEVEIVVEPGEELEESLAHWLAEATGPIFRAPPGSTWVRLRTLATEHYRESGGGPPEGVKPVFVRVLRARASSDDELAEEIARLTEVVAELCQRPPRHVHVLYDPPAEGRLAFGGRLVD